MKTKYLRSLFLLPFLLTSCNNQNIIYEDFLDGKLTKEEIKTIKTDYYEQFGNEYFELGDINIHQYFGNFDGKIFLEIGYDRSNVPGADSYGGEYCLGDGFVISYNANHPPLFYVDNEFYGHNEAYDAGRFTDEVIEAYNNVYPDLNDNGWCQ